MRRVIQRLQVSLLPEKTSSTKQADLRDMFKKVIDSVCISAVLIHPDIICSIKPTRCTNVSNLFYFGMTLYMFQTVFPSIIRSSRLYI